MRKVAAALALVALVYGAYSAYKSRRAAQCSNAYDRAYEDHGWRLRLCIMFENYTTCPSSSRTLLERELDRLKSDGCTYEEK